jgi:hypothetical protein
VHGTNESEQITHLYNLNLRRYPITFTKVIKCNLSSHIFQDAREVLETFQPVGKSGLLMSHSFFFKQLVGIKFKLDLEPFVGKVRLVLEGHCFAACHFQVL